MGVQPVFVKNTSLPAFDQKEYSTAELCSAAEASTAFNSIIGAQRIGGLWRIYPHNETTRQKLLIGGFVVRKVKITVCDKNPFIITSPNGERIEKATTRVVIGNVPISFSDDEIAKTIASIDQPKIEMRSKLMSERDRDANGKLTKWLTGRRFLFFSSSLFLQPPYPKLCRLVLLRQPSTIANKKNRSKQTVLNVNAALKNPIQRGTVPTLSDVNNACNQVTKPGTQRAR